MIPTMATVDSGNAGGGVAETEGLTLDADVETIVLVTTIVLVLTTIVLVLTSVVVGTTDKRSLIKNKKNYLFQPILYSVYNLNEAEFFVTYYCSQW